MAVPGAVTGLTVVRKFNSFEVSWTAPPEPADPADVVTEYKVRFGNVAADAGTPNFPEKKVYAPDTEYTVAKEDLITGVTDYTFQVVAVNTSGDSPATTSATTSTVKTVAPPESIAVMPMNTGLLVAWDDNEASDAALSYTVQWGLTGSSVTPKTRTVSGKEVALAGLYNYRKYDVSVLATSAIESSDYSDPRIVVPTDTHHRADDELTEIHPLVWEQDDVNLNVFRATVTDKDGHVGHVNGSIPPLKVAIHAFAHHICRWALYNSDGDDEEGYTTKVVLRGQGKNAHQALAQIHNALLGVEAEIKIQKATAYDVNAAKAVLMPGE